MQALIKRVGCCAALGLATLNGHAAEITPSQQAVAEQVARSGVPISELSSKAPDSYTIKRGDTLWAISGMYLKKPWRWPELWGMNMREIHNPHWIYPGQVLYLVKSGGRAQLRMGLDAGNGIPTDTIKISPHTRYQSLQDNALPTLDMNMIEPFLDEPLIVDKKTFEEAPRIVATEENHVALSRGDRAYVRAIHAGDLSLPGGKSRQMRLYREAVPLKDPDTGKVLGYEAQYLGTAQLVREEGSAQEGPDKDGKYKTVIVPGTVEIVNAKSEVGVGDRMLPEPPREFQNYVPHAAADGAKGRIVAIYGSEFVTAAQNQIVSINRGKADGVDPGTVFALMRDGRTMQDTTDPKKVEIKLPSERNGLMMVFRSFDNVSYALVLSASDTVEVGDRFGPPR